MAIISIANLLTEIEKLEAFKKIRKSISILYNTMASIIKRNSGKLIKNVNDVLLFCFTKTVDFSKHLTFKNVLKCSLKLVDADAALNSKPSENGLLPSIRYKINLDHGKVELATSTNSYYIDLFGTAVNRCSKIIRIALPNPLIVFKGFYDIVEKHSFFKYIVFEGQYHIWDCDMKALDKYMI